jgi:hypothetical protein
MKKPSSRRIRITKLTSQIIMALASTAGLLFHAVISIAVSNAWGHGGGLFGWLTPHDYTTTSAWLDSVVAVTFFAGCLLGCLPFIPARGAVYLGLVLFILALFRMRDWVEIFGEVPAYLFALGWWLMCLLRLLAQSPTMRSSEPPPAGAAGSRSP